MSKTYHFISGLPRSGSTLLSSVLNQNPKFSASISDPLLDYIKSIISVTHNAVGMAAHMPQEKMRQLLLDIFNSYYRNNNSICFNTNRGWTGETSLLKDLFPNFKMIVCIRDIPWILDSFELLNSKNPYTIKPLYHHQLLSNVYERSHMLMGNVQNFVGYVSSPLANVKHSMFSTEKQHILYVEYDTFVNDPESTMKQIYQFLEEPYFNHYFDNLVANYDEFDKHTNLIGLHHIEKKIHSNVRSTILPDDLWNTYSSSTFWKNNFEQFKKDLNWVKNDYSVIKHNKTNSPFRKQL